jgi:putative transcriptional regulator
MTRVRKIGSRPGSAASTDKRSAAVRSKVTTAKTRAASSGYLDGQLLIAMPAMTDKRFARSVIYLCTHSVDGAMGLIVNQRASHISFQQLLEQLGIMPKVAIDTASSNILLKDVHVGGPVDTKRGFVLHSADYHAATNTMAIDPQISLTATVDILKAMARGQGPTKSMLALGYAGWAPGQLEAEIQHNGWLHCPADPDLIFDKQIDLKYNHALSSLGIDISHLVTEAGHA